MPGATIAGTSRAKTSADATQQRGRELRVGMARIVRDLEHAYLSANEDQNLMERRTLLVGKGGLYNNVLRMGPPLTLTEDEAREGLGILVDAIRVAAETF